MIELKQTPLYELHKNAGARMVGFGGWTMPVAYQSQIEEHEAVRSAAGIFDVSHMTIIDVQGSRAPEYLRTLLANDVAKLGISADGSSRALYTCMLQHDGGILDDLIVYRLDDETFRLVVNAATRDKNLIGLGAHAVKYSVEIMARSELAMLAVQGPRARIQTALLLPDVLGLKGFTARNIKDWCVARTGYSGEDGIEIMLPGEQAPVLWEKLRRLGVIPCGLGARDTLRLEAGFNLYGLDMDETITPFECGLEWTVAFDDKREFIGRSALEMSLRMGLKQKQVGLVLQGRGVMRAGYPVHTSAGNGIVTSGTFSPTLQCSIALARVPFDSQGPFEVDIRGKIVSVQCVKPPFVRNGVIKVHLDKVR